MPEIMGFFDVSVIALTATWQDPSALLLHVPLVDGHAGPGAPRAADLAADLSGELPVPRGVWQANPAQRTPGPRQTGRGTCAARESSLLFPLGNHRIVVWKRPLRSSSPTISWDSSCKSFPDVVKAVGLLMVAADHWPGWRHSL